MHTGQNRWRHMFECFPVSSNHCVIFQFCGQIRFEMKTNHSSILWWIAICGFEFVKMFSDVIYSLDLPFDLSICLNDSGLFTWFYWSFNFQVFMKLSLWKFNQLERKIFVHILLNFHHNPATIGDERKEAKSNLKMVHSKVFFLTEMLTNDGSWYYFPFKYFSFERSKETSEKSSSSLHSSLMSK